MTTSTKKSIDKLANAWNLITPLQLDKQVELTTIPYICYKNGVVTKVSEGNTKETETIQEEYRQDIIDSLIALMHQLDAILKNVGYDNSAKNRKLCLPMIKFENDDIKIKAPGLSETIKIEDSSPIDATKNNIAVKFNDYTKSLNKFINQINDCKM